MADLGCPFPSQSSAHDIDYGALECPSPSHDSAIDENASATAVAPQGEKRKRDDSNEVSTGFTTIDTFIDLTPFAVVGSYSIYKMEKVENHEMQPTKSWDDIVDFIKPDTPARNTRGFLVKYEGFQNPAMHEVIFDALQERMKRLDVMLLVGTLACGAVLAYVKKTDTKAVPNPTVDGTTFNVYLNSNGHIKLHENFLDTLVQCLSKVRSNMRIRNIHSNSFCFEGLVASTSHLTNTGMTALRGTLLMKDKKARTKDDEAALRAWGPLMEIRNMRAPPALINFASTPPPTWADLMIPPSEQLMHYADLENNLMETITLKAWVEGTHSKASHTHRVLLMFGDAGTGKTPVSLLLAKRLTDAYRALGKQGRALSVSELEALPRLNFSEGDVLCVQEFAPSLPRGCNRCMHIEDVKGLVEVPLGADLPGKGVNSGNSGIIHIGPKVVRIFTSNCTPDAWYPIIPPDVMNLSQEELRALPINSRALLKRIVFWHVSAPLLKPACIDRYRTEEASGSSLASFFTDAEAIP